jgi:hypothetical protein
MPEKAPKKYGRKWMIKTSNWNDIILTVHTTRKLLCTELDIIAGVITIAGSDTLEAVQDSSWI